MYPKQTFLNPSDRHLVQTLYMYMFCVVHMPVCQYVESNLYRHKVLFGGARGHYYTDSQEAIKVVDLSQKKYCATD